MLVLFVSFLLILSASAQSIQPQSTSVLLAAIADISTRTMESSNTAILQPQSASVLPATTIGDVSTNTTAPSNTAIPSPTPEDPDTRLVLVYFLALSSVGLIGMGLLVVLVLLLLSRKSGKNVGKYGTNEVRRSLISSWAYVC